LNSWLQYIENSLKPIDNYLKEEVKKAFYEMGETWVKRLIYAPTYKLWSTTIEKWNMNPQKLFEKITQKLDHKIKKIYEWEYQNKIELKPDEIASFEEK
jgi:predicted hydrocarbon binding protein